MARPIYDVRDRTVLITGAARGIGAETARRLAARGANLALVGLEPELLGRLADELGAGAAFWEADVRDAAAVGRAVDGAVERFGGIDVVIANAGIAPPAATVAGADPEAFERVIDVNLLGVWPDRAGDAPARARPPGLRAVHRLDGGRHPRAADGAVQHGQGGRGGAGGLPAARARGRRRRRRLRLLRLHRHRHGARPPSRTSPAQRLRAQGPRGAHATRSRWPPRPRASSAGSSAAPAASSCPGRRSRSCSAVASSSPSPTRAPAARASRTSSARSNRTRRPRPARRRRAAPPPSRRASRRRSPCAGRPSAAR